MTLTPVQRKKSMTCQCPPRIGCLQVAPYDCGGLLRVDRYCGICGKNWPVVPPRVVVATPEAEGVPPHAAD